MSDIDAVITNLELQIESRYVPYGHFVSLRFIDIKPSFPKVKKELSNRKKWHLVCKIEAKNAHSYCEALKQKSINELAISKLTKN